jgi:hypothetical protein
MMAELSKLLLYYIGKCTWKCSTTAVQGVLACTDASGSASHQLNGWKTVSYWVESIVSVIVCSLFARLISHQPAVLFSQNEPATSNQPQPASSTLLSQQTSTSHQPPANRTGCWFG